MRGNSNDERYVLIIGSSNMDLNIYGERLPLHGETVTGGTFKQYLGGKGANQAVASARSGANTKFIVKIGKDPFGDQMISQFMEEGIDTSRIIRDAESASGIAFILIDKNGENIISVAPGANAKLSLVEIQQNSDIIKNAGSIAVQMEIPIETILEIFKIASKGSAKKILNPAPLRPIPSEILKYIDILVPNEGELFRLNSLLDLGELSGTSEEKIIMASKNIVNIGVDTIITTLGSKGCLIYHNKGSKEENEIIKLPAFKVSAVDTVGAGDCFIGVLACKLCQNIKLEDAVKYAISAASIAVTRKGAQASMPYADEIEKRYQDYNRLSFN
ncbi:MAG: ribokinase [Promethearchaeota archaeon]